MEADEEISEKRAMSWKEKGDAAIAEHRAGEERHGADGREIPWMRHNAQHGGENDLTAARMARSAKREWTIFPGT